jgi:opacity protein-like surface antigen
MKKSILLATLAVCAVATPAFAQDGSYFQVNLGGVASGNVDLDVTVAGPPVDTFSGDADLESGFFASAAGGFKMNSGWAVEAEIVYAQSDIDTADADAALGYALEASTTSTAVLVNFVYNFGSAGSFVPYIGAGVGGGNSEYELDGASDEEMGLAWQVKAGVTIPMESVTLDVGYRYVSLPRYDVRDGGDSVSAQGSGHVISVGARYGF